MKMECCKSVGDQSASCAQLAADLYKSETTNIASDFEKLSLNSGDEQLGAAMTLQSSQHIPDYSQCICSRKIDGTYELFLSPRKKIVISPHNGGYVEIFDAEELQSRTMTLFELELWLAYQPEIDDIIKHLNSPTGAKGCLQHLKSGEVFWDTPEKMIMRHKFRVPLIAEYKDHFVLLLSKDRSIQISKGQDKLCIHLYDKDAVMVFSETELKHLLHFHRKIYHMIYRIQAELME